MVNNCAIETYNFEIKVYYFAKTEDEKQLKFINFIELINGLNELDKKIHNNFELVNSKSYQFRGILKFNY